jgi:hypothetical protein
MQLLSDASRQLYSRPADEHFESHEAIKADAKRAVETGSEVDCSELIVLPRELDDPVGPFRLQLDDGRTVTPNHYSMSQLCGLAKLPMGGIRRVVPKTAAQALNESLRYIDPDAIEEDEGPRGIRLLLETTDGVDRVRSITSQGYSRVWDWQWLQEVERWLLPRGYTPALPTINTDERQTNIMGNSKPALFRGDRDSFAFYYTEKDAGGNDFGGLRRGFMVWNSEVGHRSIGYCTMLFRDMCANFLIWDAANVDKQRRIHRGDMQPFFLQMQRAMSELSRELEPVELQKIELAIQTAFAGDGSPTDANKETAAKRLTRQFRLTKSLAAATVDSALIPENITEQVPLSYFSVANALTWEARDSRYASSMVELGNTQKDILQAVGQ